MENFDSVWDKVTKQHLDVSKIDYINEYVYLYKGKDIDNIEETYERFFEEINFTPKMSIKDINKNNIYENSSIFTFIFKDGDIDINMTGYFEYHKDELRHEVIILDWDKTKTKSNFSVLSYNMNTMSTFKVVDTKQENKLNLYETDEEEA